MTPETYRVLHDAVLRVLAGTGVRVESEPALALLAAAGVRIDRATSRVYPDDKAIRAALATAPKRFCLYGREAGQPLPIGGPQRYIMAGGASVRVLEPDGRYVPATWEHLRQFLVLLDALPHVHVLLNQVDPQESAGHYYRRIAAEMFLGSAKPCCLQAGGTEDLEVMIEMAARLRGSREALAARPLFLTGSNAEPPLCIPAHAADILVAASRAGVPVGVGDYAMMGITAPVTVAGAAVQRHAVQLVALLLSQCARPGAAFYYVAASGSANLRTLDPVMANPHAVLVSRLSVELGAANGLPVCALAVTDAKQPDAQAACERTAMLQAVLRAGAHLVQGPTSMMDQMMLSSVIQAVIDDDIAGYLLAACREPAVGDETLALDAIREVASDPSYGELKFAGHPHTAAHVRDDEWQPQVFDYDTFAQWQKAGSHALGERAAARVREILANHRPPPVERCLEQAIRSLAE